MKDKRKQKKFLLPIIVVLFYYIYFYIIVDLLYQNGWLMPKNSLTNKNLAIGVLADTFCMLPLVIGLLVFFRKRIDVLGIKKSLFSIILLGIYILQFIMYGDFTLMGIYEAVFYLLFVGIPEEIIFRGYLYLQLKDWNRIGAFIISGAIFGIFHAVLPLVFNGSKGTEILIRMFSEVGGGIGGGLIFICFYELGGSLLVPIIIHALLDYSAWGVPVLIISFIYLYFKNSKSRTKQ